MMLVLVDADILLEALHNSQGFEDFWEMMRSPLVAGYITKIGLNKIRRYLRFKPNVEKVISCIEGVVECWEIDESILNEVRLFSSANYDATIEFICAWDIGVDAIVALNPNDFDFLPQEILIYSISEFLAEARSLQIEQLERQLALSSVDVTKKQATNLSQWFQGIIEDGWERVEDILDLQQRQLGYNFRDNAYIERVKLLNLKAVKEPIILLVRIKPEREEEIDIQMELYPNSTQSYLPENLQIMVLDEDEVVIQTEARSMEPSIGLRIAGEFGQRFSIQVALGEIRITEAFVI